MASVLPCRSNVFLKNCKAADPLPIDIGRKQRSEPVPPEPHHFMAYVDPARSEWIFNIPQARRERHIHHHDQPDDFGRRVEIPERAGWFLGSEHRLTESYFVYYMLKPLLPLTTRSEGPASGEHVVWHQLRPGQSSAARFG